MTIAYHIADGPFDFRHGIDAQHAVARHPGEWSREPWPRATVAAVDDKAAEPKVCDRCGQPLKGPQP